MTVVNIHNIFRKGTLNSVLLSFLAFQILSGCKQEQKVVIDKVIETESIDKVQAIFKVQSDAYDTQKNAEITSDYTNRSKLSVPKSLLPQSKWIMFEGPVLENDKVAYRYYADARHRFDIYGKKVSDLVMDTVSWDYHNIMDWGSDILKVGNSLGIGSPAIFYEDSVYCFENWDRKEIEVLASNAQNSTIRTTFYGLMIGDVKMNLQQDWSLSMGNYHSTIDLKRIDGDLPKSMVFATGIVKHLDDYTTGQKEGQFYGYNWGLQSFHKQNLGMAIISNNDYAPKYINGKLSHLTIFEKSQQGVKYQFLSVWADGVGDINNEEKFVEQVNNTIATVAGNDVNNSKSN